jgi:hypothetical protein
MMSIAPLTEGTAAKVKKSGQGSMVEIIMNTMRHMIAILPIYGDTIIGF